MAATKRLFKSEKTDKLIQLLSEQYKVPKIELNQLHLAGFNDTQIDEEAYTCSRCFKSFDECELEDGLCEDCIEAIEHERNAIEKTYQSLNISMR